MDAAEAPMPHAASVAIPEQAFPRSDAGFPKELIGLPGRTRASGRLANVTSFALGDRPHFDG
jgi:hypothetical protein